LLSLSSALRKKAEEIQAEVVRQEPGNTRAWYLLSQEVEQPAQGVDCLKRVLAIDPDNVQAKRDELRRLRTETQKELAALRTSILDRAFKGKL
jgi:cytochrome c-type biogenesis protein CcmH/NrfG